VHKVWCMWVFPNVLVVQPLNGFFSNQPHHTCARPCRRPSKSQKMGARARGCGKCPQATRPYVHNIWCMCVFPNVLVVQPLHGLFFTTHVQDHAEAHRRVKRWGQGQGVVESAHKLQGPMCINMEHVCLPKSSCSTTIA
jgi:hypothetical protein